MLQEIQFKTERERANTLYGNIDHFNLGEVETRQKNMLL